VLAWSYWKKEQKRDRIRFAKEMGRKICTCTESGEITLLDKVVIEGMYAGSVVRCPKCNAAYDIPDKN
jgi:ribosomal protein L32